MDELLQERCSLARDRIKEIPREADTRGIYADYFIKLADMINRAGDLMDRGMTDDQTMEELQSQNRSFYEDQLAENYDTCFGNPDYTGGLFGGLGRYLSFLYSEIHGTIVYACEKKVWDFTIAMELFLEIYAEFSDASKGIIPSEKTIRDILRSYICDYCQDFMEERILDTIDPSRDFATRIIMSADLNDLRYLYRFGEYISDNELKVADFLNSLPQDKIEAMARTYTEGYRIGFINGRKDLSKKKTVAIIYNLGFERMVREAIIQFKAMGLSPVIYRHSPHAMIKKGFSRKGYTGGIANPQYDYDHRQDEALFLTEDFVQKKLRAMQNVYEEHKEMAALMGGPAVIETFGEKPFDPVCKKNAWSLNEAQQQLSTELSAQSSQITNRYIIGEERSFTIIAYPLPEIGGDYESIFNEIVRINTLDYKKYERIQQRIIEALDKGEWVEIKGRVNNETDMLVHLHTLEDITSQTNFENCVADVNIPVGEVFTSPVLAGTAGTLHVSEVYLNGLLFRDLKLVFDGGRVKDYSCANFENVQDNRKYIEDNILFNHDRLPIGEFAIGTNTTAYVIAEKYHIADKLPILIAEKMGPHFAVGDTCYSWCEDIKMYNPDGRECIARDNEISVLRKEDLSQAYFGCHTDITIPYEELGSIAVIDGSGNKVYIIENGRFVLDGCRELNEPFDQL